MLPLPLPVALVNQVKMLQTVNENPKTQSNDKLTDWRRGCAIQIQDVSQIFSPTPFLFVRVYLSLLVSPAFIEANRLNACLTVPDHSPLNRISLRQSEALNWSCLQASKREKRERCIDKDKLRLHLMNTISISHLFLHMLLSSSPPALLRSPTAEKGSTPHLFPITFFNLDWCQI